ncbi:assimilatory sulfite reductase (NADPH) flavoprotein subunit [Buchnera aphidicola (Aphis helianthi)]|uniref:Sulfite reductase [NADPH] flavoprotein alpha-component n=1 Tax=Buchnera aphidicola (Aphis helianthi) TaxID=2315802 RepID=A0A4D6XQK9_9GAMM|nr:assimilatory sulfite reductase (NADPH) flavoprotein subunit [Buchnera aphidicola]QCI17237.1 assimilatory sulfite reductase (NADPH) flavoprotein subunit [Buchnera aphidicola (Aphis helianthi)]
MKNENPFDSMFPLRLEQIEFLKNFEKNCSNLQFAWLSGYFWHLANQNSSNDNIEKNILFSKKKKIVNNIITIISASQTGNARLLSERLNKYLNDHNKKTCLINAADYNFKKIQNEKILILIISTQGEGEPPEEALSLYKFIMSKRAPKLSNLQYSIFSLGDSSYNLFCKAGKDFDKRFNELGGKKLLDRFDSDIEYEDDYIKWSKELLVLIDKIDISVFPDISSKKKIFCNEINTYTKYNPAIATILTNQKITGRNSTKDIRHIELNINNLNLKYTPGDALGVWYQNNDNLIKQIITLLSIDISDVINIKNKNINIFDALKNHFELTNNTKKIVKQYAQITQNKFLKEIILYDKELENYVKKTPLIHMINEYPQKISSQQFVNILRPLNPRLYSISSSQAETNDEIHITVSVVQKIISGCLHLGGASGYLSELLKIDDPVKIFIEKNNNFRLPQNTKTPIIMIGSGTGIAPYRAFIQQRDNDSSTGKNWIFFGNPNFTEDFLYQIEWQKYLKRGILNKMTLAWSRDQKEKIYIQNRIKEHGEEIWDWIENNAYIYICGNASKMAKDVEKELLYIISQNGKMSIENANEFLNNLRLNKRYQRDVY